MGHGNDMEYSVEQRTGKEDEHMVVDMGSRVPCVGLGLARRGALPPLAQGPCAGMRWQGGTFHPPAATPTQACVLGQTFHPSVATPV